MQDSGISVGFLADVQKPGPKKKKKEKEMSVVNRVGWGNAF